MSKTSSLFATVKSFSRVQYFIIAIVGILSFLVVYNGLVFAYSGTYYNRADYKGYFKNEYDDQGEYVLPKIGSDWKLVGNCTRDSYKNSSYAIPNCISTKSEFIQFLKNANDSSSTIRKTGSAFIYWTMMGYGASSADNPRSKTISNAQWDKLETRLDSAEADFSTDVSSSINSYYQGTNGGSNPADDAFYSDTTSNQSGIYFKFDDGSTYRLKRACANPIGKQTWNIVPTVSANITSALPGATITWTHTNTNAGPLETDADVPFFYKTYIYTKSGGDAPVVTTTKPSKSDGWYLKSGSDASDHKSKSSTYTVDASDTDTTKICRTTVSTYSSSNAYDNYKSGEWSADKADEESDEACVVISQIVTDNNSVRPKVQIWGSDLMVGRVFNGATVASDVTTSISSNGTNTFGSWVEYAIFAKGVITNTASGSEFAGTGLSGSSVCNYSKLSFTNTGSGSTCLPTTEIGGYTNLRNIPNVAASFPTTTSTDELSGVVDLSQLDSDNKLFKAVGTVSITGGGEEIETGRTVVINAPDATINIIGDINYYSGIIKGISDIPQVVIIAKNINIAGGVNNIDAWLIASGSINTCSDVTIDTDLRTGTGVCDGSLRVNGPVMAGKLLLRRTAGSPTGASEDGSAAETFNLRADAYLWAYSQASKSNKAVTVLSTELPPRY